MQTDSEALTSEPRAPSWLSKDAKAEWRRVMPLLIKRRILTVADLGSAENYCIAIGQVRAMQRTLDAEGYVVQTERGPRSHPAAKLQAEAMTRARQLAAELGLTPVSRSRPALRSSADDDADSPLAL